ncbi:MAG: DUF1549 and DUF1553 domain-containing protein [Planctomycetaceae bacterium]
MMRSSRRVAFGVLLASLAAGCVVPVQAAGGKPVPRELSDAATQSKALIEDIDRSLEQSWTDNGIAPSDLADDYEWLRRVYLDIIGHIPSADEVDAFRDDKDKAKRSRLIDRLLEDPAYVRNWTTIWTNLAIGRGTPRGTSREGMMRFFSEAFSTNRPWKDVVYDLVTAEGHYEKNGAVNFLLAQMTMNDEKVQATAKTTRLLMGIQVQCTQCHDHPFNPWKQNQFWEFNSFFQQARRIEHRKADSNMYEYAELVNEDVEQPVFFERRNGVMEVAYPKFFDVKVDPGLDTNRRLELAKLMIGGDKPLIATAMVNRMWGHFFGYGFTRPVDDMGPHNQPSHPELLDRLTVEFVKGGYDVRQLMRWICNTRAYHLTSRFGKNNESDDPASGQTPLFSRVYVKSLEAEQLYDSLIVATDARKSGRANSEDAEKQRQDWLKQFVVAFGTDDNDEATTFNGTIPQALMMMNGPLVQDATSAKEGSYLRRVLIESGPDRKKIQKLFVSALGRPPAPREQAAAVNLIQSSSEPLAGYQDLFWALVNSNEFILNH